jgi:hypothetical protein
MDHRKVFKESIADISPGTQKFSIANGQQMQGMQGALLVK